MPAPKGHPLWGNPLKPKLYNPEELWGKACEYFEWCKDNPWIKIEQSKSIPRPYEDETGKIKLPPQIIEIPTERPYSVEGLCIYLNIDRKTFFNYSNGEGYETYFPICARIKEIIDNQYFEGGMVGAFNANIVTRKLGLAEKTETSGSVINYNATVSKEEAKIISDALENEC